VKQLFPGRVREWVVHWAPGRPGALAFILAAILALPGIAVAQQDPPAETPAATQQSPDNENTAAELEKAKAAALERMKAGRFAEAVPFAERGLKVAEALHGPEAIETGVAAHNLGFLLRRANRLAEAQQKLERALAIYERANPAVHEDTRNLIGELGQLYLRDGRGEDVVRLYDRLIERAGREGYATHAGVAHMHNNVAFVLRGLKRLDESERHWEQALAIYQAQSSPEEEPYRLALEALLDGYQSQGRTDPAQKLIADILAKLQATGQGEGRTAFRLLNRLSRIHHAAGNYAEAKIHASAALAIAERRPPEMASEQIEPLNDLARAERALGNYAAAEQGYKRALALLNKPENAANAGILNDNLAALYGQTSRFEEAETHHKLAIQLLEQALGREHREVGQAAANFGVMLNESGRYDEAEPLLRRGLAITEAQPQQDRVSIGIIVDNLAGLLRQTGRTDEALGNQQRAVSLFEAALPPNHPTLATTRNNLGRLLLDMGRFAEAETNLRRSLEIAERLYGAEHVNVAVAASNLGETYAAMGQRDKAREFLTRSLRGLERGFGANHPRLINTLVPLGRLELADDKTNQAVGLFEQAVAIELASRSRLGVRTRPNREQGGTDQKAFYGLLDALWKAGGDRVPALTVRALEIGQWNTMTSAAMALAALGARAGASDAPLSALTRERQDLAADWQRTDTALTTLLSESGARDVAREKSLRDQLSAQETRLNTIDKELQAKFPRYGDLAQPAPLSVEELRGLLRPNEAALQYVVTPEATHLWLISQSQTQWLRVPVSRDELFDLVRALRCGLDREEWSGEGRKHCLHLLGLPEQTRVRPRDPLPFQAERAHALFAMLLGPVQEAIAGKSLLIVAPGPLTSLPFHVLVTEKPQPAPSGEAPEFARVAWLGRTNAVTMLPSLASLKSLRQFARASRAASAFIGVGNPLLSGPSGTDRSAWARQACEAPFLPQRVADITSTSSLMQLVRGGVGKIEALRRQSPLPETADELCSVAKFVGASPETVLLGAKATEAQVKSLSAAGKLADARILHLATHGLLAGETRLFLASRAEPSLMLTPPDISTDEDDGLLTATEVAALRLDADWVILSACNTAGGDRVGAEALSGLARAFFYAGARSLLVSHWAVDSGATVSLITGAFAAMAKDPQMTQAEALRRSMLTLIDAGARTAHPAYWSPFVVVGSSGTAGSPAPQPAPAQTIAKAPAPAPAIVKPVSDSPSSATLEASLLPPLPSRAPALLKKARAAAPVPVRQQTVPATQQTAQPRQQTDRAPRQRGKPLQRQRPFEGDDVFNR
jgi:CHAT domain-containing protein/tetratricopeptide (TPR) repeat protein